MSDRKQVWQKIALEAWEAVLGITDHFPPCCDETPDKKEFKEGKLILDYSSRGLQSIMVGKA